ncbi:MAG: glycosyltransferase family 4 protein [Thermoplasmata archaeon]
MKLAYVSNHFWPVTGGIEQVMLDVAKEMMKRGHEVSVHCSNISPDFKKLKSYDEHEGIKVFRYPYKLRIGYYTSLFVPQITGVDIIHLNGFGMLTNDYLVRKYHKKLPIVFSTMHGVKIPTKKIMNKIYHTLYFHIIGLHTLKLADKITTLQELDIQRLEGMGIPRKKMEDVPPFLPDELLGKKWELENKPFERYIIFLGRLHIEKSPVHLLHALKKIKRDNVGLVFVGPDDGELVNLRQVSANFMLEKRVKFIGKVDEEKKYGLLANADLLVLPSMYEGFGIVLLESWAMSKPVIASRVGGVPYIVSDGKDGLLYEWGDIDALAKKIEFLLENDEVRKKMGEAGRKKVEEKYTRTKVVDKIERVYRELLETKS